MTICDVCQSKDRVETVHVGIDTPDVRYCTRIAFDLCDKCMAQACGAALLMGIRELRRNASGDDALPATEPK